MSKQKAKKIQSNRIVKGLFIGALLGFMVPVASFYFRCSVMGCDIEGESVLLVVTIYSIPVTTFIGAVIGAFISVLRS